MAFCRSLISLLCFGFLPGLVLNTTLLNAQVIDKDTIDLMIDRVKQNPVKKIRNLTYFSNVLSQTNPIRAKKLAIEAVHLSDSLHNDTLLYKSRFSRAVAYYNMSNYDEALEDFIDNKNWAKKNNRIKDEIESLNAIANIYKVLEQYKKATAIYYEALALAEKNNLQNSITVIYSNIANQYSSLGKPDSSNYYCYKIFRRIKKLDHQNQYFFCNVLTNVLGNFIDLKIEDSIKRYIDTTLNLQLRIHDNIGYTGTLYNLAQYYYKIKKYDLSESYLRRALSLANELGNIDLLGQIKIQLAQTLFQKKKFEESSVLYAESLTLNDSLNQIQTGEKISELEVKYETGKKEEEIKRMEALSEINSLKLKHSKIWLSLSILGILFCVIVAFLLFRQNKNKHKANKILETQNHEILQQKKEITDSINYAKRIQTAILPPKKYVDSILGNYFIFYKPKDIVSGDFYWCEEQDGKAFFAAVDCTGHGVPGALMSVIGFNLLNQALKEKGFTGCADILSYLDIGVHQTLRQSQEEEVGIKDGMELSVCSLDKKGALEYAGVYNSVWIVRKNMAQTFKITDARMKFFGEHMLEILPDKMQIGNNENGVTDVFTNHKIQLQKGDFVYLYSDGFADQFGGPNGKKFKYKNLKEVLVSISHLKGKEQQIELEKIFNDWKGEHEQIDDILIMGVGV